MIDDEDYGFFTPEKAAQTAPTVERQSVFKRSSTEGQHAYEQRMKRTVKTPDPEMIRYAKRSHYTVAELNQDPSKWQTRPLERGKDVCDGAKKTIEKFAFNWQVPYRNPLNDKFEVHRVVCVKLNHPTCNVPWNKVAVIRADDYLTLVKSGLPLRWGINGSMNAPVARIKAYTKTGTIKSAEINVARYLLAPPLDKYLRFLHSSGILIPSQFQLKTPRGKLERRMTKPISPKDMLAEHLKIVELSANTPNLDVLDPKSRLIKHTKVDLTYLAYWNDPTSAGPELCQDGVLEG